jgi:hypothetical protein
MGGRCRDCRAVVRRAGLAMAALPRLVLEAIPGVGVLPFWPLVVGAHLGPRLDRVEKPDTEHMPVWPRA